MLKYKDKIMNAICNILILIVTIFCFLAMYSFLSLTILKKPYVNFFGYTVFEVVTGSMSGTIEIGDMILIDLDSSYKKNDIITYHLDGNYITHRVTKIDNKEVITKGDINSSEDAPVNKKDVIGKVVHVFPKLGIWKDVLLTPKVLISCLITVLLFDYCFKPKREEIEDDK